MLIEVKGTNFLNKGAELMLYAILQKVGNTFPEASFVVEPSTGDYVKRAELGLYQKVCLHRCGVQWGKLGWIIPQKLCQRYGLVIDKEIDVVLDASGFAYSDQWGEYPSKMMAQYTKSWKKKGKKVILLPQAFGPFKNSKIKKYVQSIIENSYLIYARDKTSYEYLLNIKNKKTKIKMAPDFTILLEGEVPPYFDQTLHQVCIVPNKRMTDKTLENDSEKYINFMAKITEILARNGLKAFVLVYGGEEDKKLTQEILDNANVTIPVIEEDNALYIKGITGSSLGLIGSRFHSLINALSQGVPALGTGWSHKYQMLFKDYGFEEGLLSIDLNDCYLEEKLEFITSFEKRNELRNRLRAASDTLKCKANDMWNEVLKAIK